VSTILPLPGLVPLRRVITKVIAPARNKVIVEWGTFPLAA